MAQKKSKQLTVIKVLIVDDHKMVRDGLKLMLVSLKKFIDFKVMEAESGEDAIMKIYRNHFQVVIIDYQMPGISGAETINKILRFKPAMKILALSNHGELSCIQSMMDAGAKGFVLKNIEPLELLKAIKNILSDNIYYSNEVAVKLIEAGGEKKIDKERLDKILTRRQIEVLKMIAMEMTNEEIARKLFVARRTVDTHRQNIIYKLDVKNTAGLVNAAHKMNLMAK